ncbi:cache domain-containing protein [Desulfarculus baarsii]
MGKGNLLGKICGAALMCLALGLGSAWAADDGRSCDEREIKAVVHALAQGLAPLLKDQPNDEARVALLRKFIAPIRFLSDNSGYLFVYDSNCVNIAHAAQPQLVGKQLADLVDDKGNHPVRQTVEAGKKGGGYYHFWWPRPDTKEITPKVGYAEPIAGTDYFIGSGVYRAVK